MPILRDPDESSGDVPLEASDLSAPEPGEDADTMPPELPYPLRGEMERAYAALWDRVYHRFVHYAARRVGYDAADDLVHLTLKGMWCKYYGLGILLPDPDKAALTFLIYRVIDQQRRATRERRRNNSLPLVLFTEEPLRWQTDTELLAELHRLDQWVRQLVPKLPEKLRATYELYVIDQHDGEEVAQALGVTLDTVYKRLSRARELLRGWYETGYIPPDPLPARRPKRKRTGRSRS